MWEKRLYYYYYWVLNLVLLPEDSVLPPKHVGEGTVLLLLGFKFGAAP
jgi:hypothetical protein